MRTAETLEAREITAVLEDWQKGGEARRRAEDELFRLLYGQLRRNAHRTKGQMERMWAMEVSAGTTEIVHEAFVAFAEMDSGRVEWESRAHFMNVASKVMRRAVLARAQRRRREKWGGDRKHVSLAAMGQEPVNEVETEGMLLVELAVRKLEEARPELGEVTRLRWFFGCSHEDIAGMQGCCVRSVERRWKAARRYLYRELGGLDG